RVVEGFQFVVGGLQIHGTFSHSLFEFRIEFAYFLLGPLAFGRFGFELFDVPFHLGVKRADLVNPAHLRRENLGQPFVLVAKRCCGFRSEASCRPSSIIASSRGTTTSAFCASLARSRRRWFCRNSSAGGGVTGAWGTPRTLLTTWRICSGSAGLVMMCETPH